MSFFYDLNAKLNNIGEEQKELNAGKPVAKKTPVREALETTLAQDYKKLWEESQGPYELYNPKHPKFKANYDKWMAKNPGKTLSDFIDAMKKREHGSVEEGYGEESDEFELPKKLGKSKTNPIKLQDLLDRQAEREAEKGFDDFDFDFEKPKHATGSISTVRGRKDSGRLDSIDSDVDDLDEGQMGEDQQMMEYLKRRAQKENAHMVAVNGKNPAHPGIEFEEDGPHGKPQWLIDVQKDAERKAGQDVEECDMYESTKPVYVRKAKLAESDDMTKNQIHTIRRAARALESIIRADEEVPEWVKSKITIANDYLKTVRDYLESAMERQVEKMTGREGVTSELDEKITKKTSAGEIISDFEKSKNPKFAGKSKEERKKQALGAYYGMHPEKSNKEESVKRDDKAERAGKRVAKDIEYDEKVKDKIHGKKRDSEDSKAERAGKRVAKDIEYDEKKKAKKVKETTTSGSVAPMAVKSGKGAGGVGKGIYDSINRKVESLISEEFDVSMSKKFDNSGEDASHITIDATGAEADMIKDLLRNAGIDAHVDQDMSHDYEHEETCDSCGHHSCECGDEHSDTDELALGEADVDVSENNPDWPTQNEFSDDALQYSGGINGPKSTGQATVPVLASQKERQMSENVTIERSLFDLYKAIADRT